MTLLLFSSMSSLSHVTECLPVSSLLPQAAALFIDAGCSLQISSYLSGVIFLMKPFSLPHASYFNPLLRVIIKTRMIIKCIPTIK